MVFTIGAGPFARKPVDGTTMDDHTILVTKLKRFHMPYIRIVDCFLYETLAKADIVMELSEAGDGDVMLCMLRI